MSVYIVRKGPTVALREKAFSGQLVYFGKNQVETVDFRLLDEAGSGFGGLLTPKKGCSLYLSKKNKSRKVRFTIIRLLPNWHGGIQFGGCRKSTNSVKSVLQH
jgi:hypothetical protein